MADHIVEISDKARLVAAGLGPATEASASCRKCSLLAQSGAQEGQVKVEMRKRFSQGKKGFLFLAVELIKALKRASLPTNETQAFQCTHRFAQG